MKIGDVFDVMVRVGKVVKTAESAKDAAEDGIITKDEAWSIAMDFCDAMGIKVSTDGVHV